jgi:ABC-type transport system involved in multi-copper enzyme maturation permease subunit
MRNTIAYYEARAVFGFTALAPALLLPVFGIIVLVNWLRNDVTPTANEVMSALAVLLPLSAALSAAHLMVVEREENVDALRRSYAEPTWRLPLTRLTGALLVAGVSVGITLLLLRAAGVAYPLDQVVLPAIPATLMMVGLALLAGNITGNSPAAIVAVIAYWFLDMQTGGSVTGVLFMFNAVSPLPDIDPDLNRLLLYASAIALCLANVAWSARRRRTGG